VATAMPVLADDLRDAPPLLQADALVAQLRRCLYLPMDMPEAGIAVKMRITIVDGAMPEMPVVLDTALTADEARLMRMAVRAAASCGPYPEWMSFSAELTVTAMPPDRVAITPRNAARID